MAAAQEFSWAEYSLGLAYHHGRGVPQDDVEAVRWWRLAAEHLHIVAICHVGLAYEEGRGVPRDPAEAVTWYRQATNGVQYFIDLAYRYSRGVPVDDLQVYAWFNIAEATETDEEGMRKIREICAELMKKMTPSQL